MKIPPLTFSASWLASPESVAVERVAELAAKSHSKAARLTEPRGASWNGGRVQGSDRMSRAASNWQIDPARLWDTIHETAQFGATPKGGCDG